MDEFFMKEALNLAKLGEGAVNPNPMVGAIIVKNNKIIGSGYHKFYGDWHAEINAINSSNEDLEGSTMYVTLEPCFHFGKTPPCVDSIIKHKFKKVVIGSLDPNPLVCGKSVKKLLENNIDVKVGVLKTDCLNLNKVFFKYIKDKKPFVIMKYAMTLDGKIASFSGDSKWISSDESRLYVQKLRNRLTGIMVGVNTIIQDNPSLTCRLKNGKNPIRIIVDSNLRIPLDSKVLNFQDKENTLVATTKITDIEKYNALVDKGIGVLEIDSLNNKVDLNKLMIKLGELKIDSILLEGGSTLNFSALENNIVDEIYCFIAPKVIGGRQALGAVGGEGIDKISDCFKLKKLSLSNIGDDILIKSSVERCEDICSQES